MITTLVFYSRVTLKDVKNDIKTILKAPSFNNGEYEVECECYEFLWHCEMQGCYVLRPTIH